MQRGNTLVKKYAVIATLLTDDELTGNNRMIQIRAHEQMFVGGLKLRGPPEQTQQLTGIVRPGFLGNRGM